MGRQITDAMIGAFKIGADWWVESSRITAGLREVFDLVDQPSPAAAELAKSHPDVYVHDPAAKPQVVTAMQLAERWYDAKRVAAVLPVPSWSALSDDNRTLFTEDAQGWLDAQEAVRRG